MDTYLYSKFDENGDELSHYGLFKDVSVDSHKHMTRPVDFMLNGFNHNTKLSLLVEPLSKRYEFSEGFYRMVEIPKTEYVHSKSIINNIAEEEVREQLKKLINNEINEVNVIFTYYVNYLFFCLNMILFTIFDYFVIIFIDSNDILIT